MEMTAGGPFRLQDRLVRAAGDATPFDKAPLLVELRDPELRPVPWHVGVIPGEPAELCPVGADPGRRVEVVALDENGHGLFSRSEGNRNQGRDRFPALYRVIFPDTDESLAESILDQIGIAPRPLGRDRHGIASGLDVVDALIASL